ncbi:MAG: response regulator [Candidatus Poribacteria bacterium]|nr:response regulator [Candidatus Poribacteria bacterium]
MAAALTRAARILLVEDNKADVRLTQEALKEAGFRHELLVADNGYEALAMLRQDDPYASQQLPDMILLDLNMPQKTGWEVLQEIKSDKLLRRFPVIILSTSGAEKDVRQAYRLGANSYIVKPVDLARFIETVASLCDFWLSTATLPSH